MTWLAQRLRSPRLLAALALLLCGAAAGVVVAAPYLPRLIVEGYPAPVWPAFGSFATVAGGVTDPLQPPAVSGQQPNAALKALFQESNGRALIAVHRGRIVLSHYADGITSETKLNSYSMVKSLIGALTLKAIADGRLRSLDQPLAEALPGAGDALLGSVTLRELLEMRSGIEVEAHGFKSVSGDKDVEATRMNLFGTMARLHTGGLDAIAPDLTSEPALRRAYNYQNVNTALLGRVLARAYRMPLEQALASEIWAPAGARPAEWRRYGEGLEVTAYCCLYARPMDWARVGVFLMRNGTPGRPFLPEPMWRDFLGRDLAPADVAGGRYGLHIRQDLLDRQGELLQGKFSFFMGSRGQITYLMPDQDLVVVRFGDGFQKLHSTLYETWRSMSR
jgi:CubicO group peptidase (beta-lactamase class C family)